MPPGPLVWATRSVLQLFPPRAYMLKISRYGLGLSFMMFTKNKEGARANRTTKYKKQRSENILTHAHLWLESTQIEYSSQEMAQQV